MSRIKSALELALEKTSDIEADRSALRRAEAVKAAKRGAALFLEGESDTLLEDRDEKDIYLETMKESLLGQVKLPQKNEDLARAPRLEAAFSQLMGSSRAQKELASLFGQLKNLFAQYLDTREQMVESLISQYEPMLKQKEARLREQTGQNVRLRPEQDPEFMKLIQDRQKMLDDQYGEVIIQAKEQLKELL